MELPLDYMTLRVIWWGLVGVLLIGFAIMDGFDMGVASLLPFVAKTDAERRAVINTVGATWEGNQVWFIVGGAAIFAAWPFVYAVSFSGFYLAMFLVLMALILRPVGFKYRSKRPGKAWRRNWDWALFTGGFVPALVFGVAMGNVLQGAPFTLLCGVTSAAMLVMQGATWLGLKLEKGAMRDKALLFGTFAAVAVVLCFAIGYLFVRFGGLGFALVGEVAVDGASNPTRAEVIPQAGAWLTNFAKYPWMWALPALGFAGPGIAIAAMRLRKDWLGFIASSVAIVGIIGTVGASMFPIILPSTVNTRSSLLVWNASSSHLTLFVMLLVTLVFLPLILLYTAWVYKVLFGRVGTEQLKTNPDLY